jgi:hypothetical protein
MSLFNRCTSRLPGLVLSVLLAAPASAAVDFTLIGSDGNGQGSVPIRLYSETEALEGSFNSDVPYYGSIPRWGPDGNIYVASWLWYTPVGGSDNKVRIARYTPTGGLVGSDTSNVFFETTAVADSFQDAAFHGTRLFIADVGNRATFGPGPGAGAGDQVIRVFETDNIGGVAGNTDVEQTSLALPSGWNAYGMAFNPTDQNQLYVQARDANSASQIFRYNQIAGTFVLDAGYGLTGYDNAAGGAQGEGLDITFDYAGNMYLLLQADTAQDTSFRERLIKLAPGDYNTLTGGNLGGLANEYDIISDIGGESRGLAWGPDGRIYIGSYATNSALGIASFDDDGPYATVNAFAAVTRATHIDILDHTLPEPASMTLLAMGGLLALRRRGRALKGFQNARACEHVRGTIPTAPGGQKNGQVQSSSRAFPLWYP